jgi:N utilization substance protein B
MPNADLTILRISVYEMLFTKDMPVNISINEAVELAKKYSNDDSPSFVNALLGEIVR